MLNRLGSFFLAARPPPDPCLTPQSSTQQPLLDQQHPDTDKQQVEEAAGQRAVVIHELGVEDGSQPFSWRQFLLFLGPGFLMSIGTGG